MRIVLVPPDPFDLAATVTSHGWYRLAPFQWDDERGLLSHVDVYDERVVRFEIRQGRRRIIAESDIDVPRSEAVARIRRILQLDVDLTEFYELCRRSKRLEAVPDLQRGRLLCAPTVFEDAVKIILTTNTRWARTVEMTSRLVENFGRSAGGRRAFPRARDLAAVTEGEIRARGKVGYRARSIHQLALEIDRGTISLDHRPDPTVADYGVLHDFYLRFPGIGPYGAAHMAAMDGRHDRIAVDTEFRAWVRDHYHGGRSVKDSTMLRHYRAWGSWKYLAYWCEMTSAPGVGKGSPS